jgi:HK97 family phage major capsid protein
VTTNTKAAPATVADWESYLSELDTPAKFTTAFNDGTFSDNLKGYVSAQNKERTDIGAQVQEQVQASMAEFLKGNPGTGDAKRLNLDIANSAGAKPSPALNNPRANGAPLNGVFPDFYSFLQCVWSGNKNPSDEQVAGMKVLNEYSEKVPSEGGFLVPEEFRSQLMSLSLSDSIVRPRATVIPMGSPRTHIPSIDETSRVSSVFGGIVVYRTEEGAELTESQAAFASIKLDVTKQTALAHVPNELVRDWGAFGAFIEATLPAAVGFYEDLDFLSGSGAGEPLGALNSGNGALLTVAKESGQVASTIVWENVLKMYARMLPSSVGRAVWVASPDTFAELATMALSVGTGGSAVWLVDGTGTPQLTLLGRPVLMTEKAPAALGTAGDLNFVDFGMYLIGDYQTMTVDSSAHVKFTSDKTTFRVISRNDGRPWLQSAITPQNNSATLSPFVQLATRS